MTNTQATQNTNRWVPFCCCDAGTLRRPVMLNAGVHRYTNWNLCRVNEDYGATYIFFTTSALSQVYEYSELQHSFSHVVAVDCLFSSKGQLPKQLPL